MEPANSFGTGEVGGCEQRFSLLTSVTGALLSTSGFDVPYQCGGDGNEDDYFVIIGHDRVMLMFKGINASRMGSQGRLRSARMNPDALYKEFVGREIPVHGEPANTSDGLRAFEIIDNSGYVLSFWKRSSTSSPAS